MSTSTELKDYFKKIGVPSPEDDKKPATRGNPTYNPTKEKHFQYRSAFLLRRFKSY